MLACMTLLNTYDLFSALPPPPEYNSRMLGRLSLVLGFPTIRLLYFREGGGLNKQWVMSNVMWY